MLAIDIKRDRFKVNYFLHGFKYIVGEKRSSKD